MSFLAWGSDRLPAAPRIVASSSGSRAASSPSPASTMPEVYENFLLIIAYWIGPWLAVVLIDRLTSPRDDARPALPDDPRLRTGPGRSPWSSGRHLRLAVLGPDQLPRADPDGEPRLRRPHLLGRLPHLRRVYAALSGSPCRPPPRPGGREARARRRHRPTLAGDRDREARLGLAEGGIPIGGALFGATVRARPWAQPAGAGRRPVRPRGDRRVPPGRAQASYVGRRW